MREVIARIADGSEFREFKQEYGKTVITVCRRRDLGTALTEDEGLR
jgi:acetyl-CoA carboxylase carboxyltransferase component